MGRIARLKPKYSKAKRRWILSIPPHLSSTGARMRVAYETEEEALEKARWITEGQARLGPMVSKASKDLVACAVEYEEIAIELGFRSLRHFCEDALAKLEAAAKSPTLGAVLEAFESDRAHRWSASYLSKRWRPFRGRLVELEEVQTSDLDGAFWRAWFSTWREQDAPAASTYNQTLGDLRAVFGHPLVRSVHPVNPLGDVPAMKAGQKSVAVLRAEQVRAILETAWRHDREMVPFFAVAFFAGLRPDSEARRARFADFKWDSAELAVRVTKTGDAARFVEISPALRAWLAPWARMRGPICPANFRRRFRQVVRGYYTTAGAEFSKPETWCPLVPWSHDVSRHTYGSMFEAAHRAEPNCRERLAANMGHTSYKTFWSAYRHALPVEEAVAFWAITPPAEDAQAIGQAAG